MQRPSPFARPWVLLCALVALLSMPGWGLSGFWLSLLSQMGIAVIACLSFNLLMGQGGMLSFGHAVYSGLGAYGAMWVLNHACPPGALLAGMPGFPVSLLPLAGGLSGLAAAAVLGYVATRGAGTTFAMITLGLGELVFALAMMLPGLSGGEGGITGNRVVGPAFAGISFGPPVQVAYLVMAYTLASAALLYAFTRTPLGCLLRAVRDNPLRLDFVGYDPRRVRYLAFLVSAFFAGVAGGLATLVFETVNAEALGAQRSGAYVLFTVLGGTGYFWGPILGAVLLVLSTVLFSTWTPAWLLYLGLLFIAMLLFSPHGLAGLLHQQASNWRRLGGRRLWRSYAGLGVSGGLACAGLAAGVEMLYRLQLDAVQAQPLVWGPWTLDPDARGPWLAAALALLAGALGAVWAHRQLRRTLSQAGVEPPSARTAASSTGHAAPPVAREGA